MRFMARCPEATEEACSFLRVLQPSDYDENPKIMRTMVNDAVAHGKSVLIRDYQKVTRGVQFDSTSLDEHLNVYPEALVDVQGECIPYISMCLF